MAAESRTMNVHILGHEYKIRSTESGEFVREVALYVDELMHQISSKMSTGTPTQVAVLAALNIAEELFRMRRGDGGTAEDADEVDERMAALVSRVDGIIRGVQEDGAPLQA
ncbi:cell division protein ZapA, partial [bacterium]|nr:cell division protein ZapA [bacterium]